MLQGSKKRETSHCQDSSRAGMLQGSRAGMLQGSIRERLHIAMTPVEEVCFKGVKERDITLLGLQ